MAALKPPSLKIDVAEFFSATRFLTDRQAQAYLRLRCYLWENGSLPAKLADLATIANVDAETFAAWQTLLADTFDMGESGEWHDFALEQRRQAVLAGREKMSQGGRDGARTRYGSSGEAK